MELIYEAQYCTSTCQVTDRYKANVTVNPGATTTRFNGSNLYFPDSGNFQNKHFKMWSVCQGSVCGSADTGNLLNASVDYLSGYGDRHGKVLTSAVTLWVYFAPWASYQSDGAKTHDADCEAASVGNACRYSY
ncbi:hypothetical protein [Dactylosporangium sp. NPDC051484]|uniref:hypothetical protein n=1 Tax=Dactylosporangium sp. NPDC051484 TaxID=3154942 RepID=UPI00344D4C5C